MITYNNTSIIEQTAKRIDGLRLQHNLSLRELAKKSGISHSALSNIIKGAKIPNIYTISNICNALNISLSDFFEFDERVIQIRGKEAILIKIFREVSPMSQDTLIKVSKCMK